MTGPERNVYMRQQALDSPRTLRRCADCVSMEHNVSASVCVVANVCRVAPCLVRSERQASEPTASCCTFATLGRWAKSLSKTCDMYVDLYKAAPSRLGRQHDLQVLCTFEMESLPPRLPKTPYMVSTQFQIINISTLCHVESANIFNALSTL